MTSINIRKLSHSEMDLYRKPLLPKTWSCFPVDKDIDTQMLRKILQKDLDKILKKRTALVIAHRLATIESSDKILVLKGGSLIEEGTHSELRLKKGLYFQLSELQQKGFANF